MTEIARKELRSYKQLPQIWYQIQPKFRDEPRPKSGLLRVRQFIMKDSYSFDIDAAGLDVSYQKHYDAYCRIFDRCGLKYVVVEAHSGAMGGSQSQEFMVLHRRRRRPGRELRECSYAANLEKATSKLDAGRRSRRRRRRQACSKCTRRARRRSKMSRASWAFRQRTRSRRWPTWRRRYRRQDAARPSSRPGHPDARRPPA